MSLDPQSQLRAIVLHEFVEREQMTDLENRFNNPGSTYRSRRSELTAMGLLRDSGQRREQEGGTRIIWEITPDGRRTARIFTPENTKPTRVRKSAGARGAQH